MSSLAVRQDTTLEAFLSRGAASPCTIEIVGIAEHAARLERTRIDLEPDAIVIPHEREIQPVSAVKHLVIQTSLAMLQRTGLFQRYRELIDPSVLQELQTALASAWAPIVLADAHYRACDDLGLTTEQLSALGQGVGVRLQETSLVTAAKKNRDSDFDLWNEVGSLHRMWARLYQGGSALIAKLGPKDLLIELRGFSLNRYRYHRYAQLASIGAAFTALGVQLESIKVASYSAANDETQIRVVWA